jgi:hypothetical protein
MGTASGHGLPNRGNRQRGALQRSESDRTQRSKATAGCCCTRSGRCAAATVQELQNGDRAIIGERTRRQRQISRALCRQLPSLADAPGSKIASNPVISEYRHGT